MLLGESPKIRSKPLKLRYSGDVSIDNIETLEDAKKALKLASAKIAQQRKKLKYFQNKLRRQRIKCKTYEQLLDGKIAVALS